ncbi:hypothetical protein C7999DRAFT_13186 [Corynascus novoguineensis]|uniref:Ankyrin repeat protein n=1 Tax=Corynascus novoguineensis TaxID=1126955 RepID=A0AAN7HKH9_9PEZI|nr:hypothetical protein C7999DRAFT_13186 [Corynascus novoguineensis]
MASPPGSTNAGAASGSRIGRPPQWTVSRSRKLVRLYLYSTLSIEKIIKVLEDDGFSPRKNSAQKTIHKMLDNDPRYLRPESRVEMSKRLKSLAMSPNRRKKRPSKHQYTALGYDPKEVIKIPGEWGLLKPEATSLSGKSVKTEDSASLDYATSPDTLHSGYLTFPPRHHDIKDPREESCLAEIHDIKRRVSNCSTQFAMQLSSLVKEFTISICSDDRSSGRRPSAALSEGSEPADMQNVDIATEPYEPFPDPGFALPGDFLTAHTRSCADFPGQQHGEGDCWCSIAKHTSAAPDSWLLTAGELSDRARHVLRQPLPAHLGWRDSFGNTPLHLFAALDGYQERLLGMVRGSGRGELATVNSAGQTFLHVLNLEWFNDLSYPSSPLKQLLALIMEICPGLVYETDAYGRTFFHRAYSLIRDRSLLAGLVSLFDPTLVSRDAFGFNPVPDTDTEGQSPYIPPRRIGSLSPQVEDIARANPRGKPKSVASEGSLLAYHARLVQVIHSSYTNPSIEDADGRNGLHCLAEAILDQQAMDRHVRSSSFPSSASRPNLKRKLELNDPAPSTPIGTATAKTPSSSPPAPSGPLSSSSGSSPAEGILPARLRHLYALLEPSVSVSVSHYDCCGYTPLMAFIEHIPDEQDDKAKTLQAILETLVRAGASGDEAVSSRRRRLLEARNRRGETPLLMAARLGRKVALATLLEGGANVHARDADGRGLLEVLDAEVGGARARAEVGLYARLEACRALLTGRREWGVGYVHHGEPAIVREWRMR